MLNKHNFEIARLAAKEPSRYTLTAIHVTPQATYETDGHQLIKVTTPKMSAKDFPVIEGASEPTDDFEPFNLPAGAALEIAKAIPKRQSLPVLEHAAIGSASNQNGHAEIQLTDLETPLVLRPNKQDGQFPDAERVIPDKDKAEVVIGFNAQLLRDVLSQFVKFTAGERSHCVAIRIYPADKNGDRDGIRIDAATSDQEMTAVVMPHRL